ncbi:zinc ribbon domain-containing protein [Sulfitobacter sp. R18_1]|uniref:zinc ribbon domain-containing protein n=1 Tax=Sulfitobacter sp. R18_1 TaxID=2821104 RepID=UPI001ADB2894|nr:zinc ribbon domain-containing protein [Sulfitobacter sp. R18_1]MBO9428341.1 transposase [Sulfitobacter sp. R18_1]
MTCDSQQQISRDERKSRLKPSVDGLKQENTSELHAPMGVTSGSGSTSIQISLSTLESQAKNSNPHSTPKSKSCGKNTQKQSLSVTLPLVSISNDEALSPYWNAHCEANQSEWWLPHRIASPDPDSLSSGTSLNYREVESSFWKKTIKPIRSMFENSLRLSLPSATPFTESARIKGTRKIRVFPKDEEYLIELCRQHRRAYNLTIACFIEADRGLVDRKGDDLKKINLRRTIREFVASEVAERGEGFASAACDEAVLSAFNTRDAIIRERRQGKKCGFTFKSLKDVRQSFIIQKLAPGFVTRHFDVSEDLPEEAFKKLTRIVSERGQWFICAQKYITTIGQDEIQVRTIAAIDPGVRTFGTVYSENQCTTYGEGFYAQRIWPLIQKIYKLVSLRVKARNDQWKRHYQKRLNKLMIKARNLVDDLHRRVAYDLVQRFDVLLLPTFETSQMVEKQKRKLRTKTARSMLGLGHYRFQQKLNWMCRKYGKRLVLVNEAYTSKTRSWDGVIHDKLGGAKQISDGRIVVDRDVNGARGILLRALYGNLGHGQAI